MPREIFAPVRRSELLQLAASVRDRYLGVPLDEVAEHEDITFTRLAGGKEAGFAYIERAKRPMFLESLARPGEKIRVWGEWEEYDLKFIFVNPHSGIPEQEVFWHEFYHLAYSPRGIQRSEQFAHQYSTLSVLHSQEERRADEFAAAVLIPDIRGLSTIEDIMERYNVSERLARHAISLRSALRH